MLAAYLLGTSLADINFMKISITPLILSHISRDIAYGRPLWAMLRANEYFNLTEPLRRQLAIRAMQQSKQTTKAEKLFDLIINQGKCFGELSELEQDALLKLEPACQTRHVKIILTNNLKSKVKVEHKLRDRVTMQKFVSA